MKKNFWLCPWRFSLLCLCLYEHSHLSPHRFEQQISATFSFKICSCHSPTQPQLNLNSSWSDYIMPWTTPPTPPTPPKQTLCCCCAAGRATIGDSTSLLRTYRATVNVVTTKINPTLDDATLTFL